MKHLHLLWAGGCALTEMMISTALSFAGVSVHISSHQLRKLLQTNTDRYTAPYFNTSDFIVTKDSESCYESIWTLTWRTKAGDLPNVINVRSFLLVMSTLNPFHCLLSWPIHSLSFLLCKHLWDIKQQHFNSRLDCGITSVPKTCLFQEFLFTLG